MLQDLKYSFEQWVGYQMERRSSPPLTEADLRKSFGDQGSGSCFP